MHRSLLLPSLLAGTFVSAQHITNVTVNPNPLHACVPATFNVIGTGPAGMEFTYVNTSIGTNDITLVFDLNTGASGNVPFNKPVGPMGPFAAGQYTLHFSLRYNNNVLNTWNGNLTIQAPVLPNPGEYTAIQVCPNAAPFQLTSRLGGNPDPGGLWMDPQLETVPNGMFTPGTSMAGDYMYHFDLPSPCEMQFQMLSISYLPNTSAGSNATVTLCTAPGAPAVPLIGKLGGTPTPGGTWTGPGTSGIFTPGVSAPGNYVYHVDGTPPCAGSTATVTVQPGAPSNAGTGGTAFFCADENYVDLSSYVWGGSTTGIWYSPTGLGITYWNQPVDIGAGPGAYMYIVTSPPCPADTAFVVVTLLSAPCTVGIGPEQGTAADMALHPNPAHGQVVLDLHGAQASQGLTAVVADVNGRTVLRQALPALAGTAREVLDISRLAPGAYTIRLQGGAKFPVQRLMVE